MELQIFSKIEKAKIFFSDLFNLKKGILGLIFLILFIVDFIGKYFSYPETIFRNSPSFIKIILQAFIVFLIFRKQDIVAIQVLKKIFILLLIFIAGHIFLKSENLILERIYSNIKIFDWYIFIFLLYAGYSTFIINKDHKTLNTVLFKTLEFVYIINFILIVIGLIFEIEIFKAYYLGNRFGYNGLIRNATHASYIYMLFICYFYYKYTYTPKPQNKILLVSTFIVSVLLATKAILLFIIIFCLYFFILKKNKTSLLIFGLMLVITGFSYQWIIQNIIKKHFNILYEVYQEQGIITMLFSYRDQSISKYFLPYIRENWTLFNYIFGGAEFNLNRTEFEILDLVWFFGILGMVYYVWLYNKFILSFKILIKYFPLFIIFLISILAGSFFSSVPVMTMMFVVSIYIKNIPQKIKIT